MGRVLTLAAAAIGWACGGSAGAVATIGDLTVSNPYMPEPAGAEAAAVYVTVANGGTDADTLVAVSAAWARRGSLHDVVRAGGLVHMTPVAGIPIGPGETVHLVPGGLHAMLMELDPVPVRPDTVAVALTFRRAGTDTLRVPVVSYAELERYTGRNAEDGHGGPAP